MIVQRSREKLMKRTTFAILAALLLLLLAAAPARAVVTRSRPPATTRAAEGVTVKVVEIDTAPTLITESVKEVSASELFAKIGSHAGTHFRPQPEQLWDMPPVQGQKFTAEFDKQPFWDAVREACEATGLLLQPQWIDSRDPEGITIVQPGSGVTARAPVFIAGPYMIKASSIQRSASLRYGDEKSATGPKVRLQLQVTVESRLREHVTIGQAQIDQADDDAGHSLVSPKPDVGTQMQSLQYSPTFAVTMESPANRGQRIVALRGHFVARLPRKMLAIDAPWPPALTAEKNEQPIAESPAGPNHLAIRALRRGGGAGSGPIEVELTLLRAEGGAVSDDAWREAAEAVRMLGPKVRIARPNDPRRFGYSSSTWNSSAERMTLRVFLPPPPADAEAAGARLRINVPLEMRTEPVEFTFKDLPLP
jgi:hypothetical protein